MPCLKGLWQLSVYEKLDFKGTKEKYRKYGFSGVIAKPYKIQELSIELNRVITEAARYAGPL